MPRSKLKSDFEKRVFKQWQFEFSCTPRREPVHSLGFVVTIEAAEGLEILVFPVFLSSPFRNLHIATILDAY